MVKRKDNHLEKITSHILSRGLSFLDLTVRSSAQYASLKIQDILKGEKNKKIIVVVADISPSGKLNEFQKKNNINCPVLYFQETYDTQDKKGWRLLMNPFDPQGGMSSHPKDFTGPPKVQLTDANDDRPPYNQNQYSSFDPQDQYIGVKTPLDEKEFEEDPMSSTWKGHEATHNALMSGKFKDRTRDPNAEDRFAVK